MILYKKKYKKKLKKLSRSLQQSTLSSNQTNPNHNYIPPLPIP